MKRLAFASLLLLLGACAQLQALKNGAHSEQDKEQLKQGYELVAANRPQDAIPLFDKLIAADPGNAMAYNGKAVALDHTGDHAGAQALYAQALKPAPDSLPIQNNLAMSMILGDQYDAAIALLEKLNASNPGNKTVRQNLALAYGLKGNGEKALALNKADMTAKEAEENLRFYQEYIRRHKAAAPAVAAAPTIPPSIADAPVKPSTTDSSEGKH